MRAEGATPRGEPFTPFAVDQAVAAVEDLSEERTPAEAAATLERGLACMRLLRQVLCREEPAVASAAPSSSIYLGRFEIRRELGRGAYGMVFLAYDPQLGREVALKVPQPEVLVTPELRTRFVREAQAAAALDHPNLVAVHEAGEIGPIGYIVSAYCPGVTLAAWLKGRTAPVPPRLAAQLLATLADAVQHAHGHGVIHRDLKPSNILLQFPSHSEASRTEITGQPLARAPAVAGKELDFIPKITDFGLAKVYSPAAGVGEAPTQSGAIVGTPSYMAPEQARGRSSYVGPPADVYALGAILYEVLVGRPPFQGETPLDTLDQARAHDPVPLRRLRPKLPRDLETITLKSLAKDPHQRYVSAAALADDLRHFLEGKPIRARPVGGRERLWRWCRRQPAVASLAATLALTALLGFAAVTWQWRRAEANFREALEATHEAILLRQEKPFDEFSTWLIHHGQAPEPVQRDRLCRQALENTFHRYQQLLQRQGRDVSMQIKQAIAHVGLAWIAQEKGLSTEALAEFQQASAILDALLGNSPTDAVLQHLQAATCFQLGNCQSNLGHHDAALQSYQRVLAIAAPRALDHPADGQWQQFCVWSHRHTGLVYYRIGYYDQACRALQQSLALCEKLAQDHPEAREWCQTESAYIYQNLSLLHHQNGSVDQARAGYHQARTLFEKLIETHPFDLSLHRDLAVVYCDLAAWLIETNQAEQALPWCRKACALLEKVVKASPTEVQARGCLAQAYINLGEALRLRRGPALHWTFSVRPLGQLWDYTAALVFTEKARARLEELVSEYPEEYPTGTFASRSDLAICYHNRGEILVQFACWQAAEAAFRQAIVHQRAAQEQWPKVVRYRQLLSAHYQSLADLYRHLGRPDDATAMNRKRQQLGPGNPAEARDSES
jgi:serine/threonine protein kinase/tetratricopeptide (TPR) repeat protein